MQLSIARRDNSNEHIFDIVLQVSKWAYFLRHIAREHGMTEISIWYHEGASVHRIAREQAKTKVNYHNNTRDSFEGMAWPTTQQSNIICCQAWEVMTTSIFLMSYCKRSNDNYILDVARSGCIAREQVTWQHHCKMQGCNNLILYMLLVARMTATSTVDCKDDSNVHTFSCRIARNNDKWWLIATKECKIAPSNNRSNLYSTSWEQAMIAGWQHCQSVMINF